MPSTSSLCILSNLTQKIIHSKTGHIFLLYFSISDDTTCTIDLTLADTGDGGPDPDEDTQEKRERLERWWSASWTAAQLREIGTAESIAANVEKGELNVRGWSKSKMERDDLDLKLSIGPADEARMTMVLPQCSAEEAFRRQKSLLTKITEEAQSYNCRIFPKVLPGLSETEVKARAEAAQLTKLLLKRDKTIEDLNAQLETINDQLKEYIRDAEPSKPVHSFPKIPANHGKASVTKKRRLVQQVEYED